VVCIALLSLGAPAYATIPEGCKQQAPQTLSGSASRAATQAGSTKKAVTLTPANDNSKVVERNFGEGRAVYRRELGFIADRPITVAPSRVSVSIAGGLVDPATTEVFPVEHRQVTFGVEINRVTRILTVVLCIDPHSPYAVGTGKYVGTILIAGPGIVPAQIPLTVTLKSAKVALVWLLAILGLALGIFVKVLSRHLKKEPTGPWLFGSMVVVGGILTIGVVLKLYYEPALFDDGFSSFWPILIGSATATAGGTTLVDLFKGA
jgi:hypothetical protein